ncbi:MAG TPA: S8 family serine peptidase [Gemmatimonadales bacterium]|nr:S8 family serine peptidase [Gemmatimonadales bacterium]
MLTPSRRVAVCAAALLLAVAPLGPLSASALERQQSPGRAVFDTTPPSRQRAAPPAIALARGWMSLDITGVDRFRQAMPLADGRGVLIAILDTGIDPGIPGLGVTSDGRPKVLDLRDFSEEGRIALKPLVPQGDTVTIDGVTLGGMRQVAGRTTGPWYGGALSELALGTPPAADLNGNGSPRDLLPVVVGRASDGWVLYADTDGNGTLANERPVHDYLVGRETFGWHSGAAATPATVAANISSNGDAAPTVDLYFDTSGHGSHVAGIAAGHDIYGEPGLDGVAPGAQLLGLKIANDGLDAISTTESMRDAMDYAIEFASARGLPLVMNMSFGVGNEREGASRIEAIVDSVLAAHPNVVFTISAGNDGPGISTVGFPGSSARAISVGALLPGRFVPTQSGRPGTPDAVAYFSARGGEVPKPDIVTPGVAYSTVPNWDAGGEIEAGTSMASPHAAGLAAVLLSAASQAHRTVSAAAIRQALMVTADRLPAVSFADQGAGIPDAVRAWQWLTLARSVPPVSVQAEGGMPAALLVVGPRDSVPGQVAFQLRGSSGARDTFRLRSNATWLAAPGRLVLADSANVTLALNGGSFGSAPLTGVVSGWSADTLAGPAFRLVTTVARAAASNARFNDTLGVAQTRQHFFGADSGVAFNVRVTSAAPGVLAFLHAPGGMPFLDGVSLEAGRGEDAALFRVDARDATPGYWQVSAAASVDPAVVSISLEQSPVTTALQREGDSVRATIVNRTDSIVRGQVLMGLLGAEEVVALEASGSAPVRRQVEVPAWARYLVADIVMPPAQWERLTDFGVILYDSAGTQLEQSPLNYAHGRLHHAFDQAPGIVTLGLFPGFADSAGAASWRTDVRLRFYAESPMRISAAARQVSIPPRATARLGEPWSEPAWTAPAGASLLGVITIDTGTGDWSAEAPLPAGAAGTPTP